MIMITASRIRANVFSEANGAMVRVNTSTEIASEQLEFPDWDSQPVS